MKNFRRLHIRLFTILVYRFRIDVRRRRIHRIPHFFDLSFIDNGLPTEGVPHIPNRILCDSSYNCIQEPWPERTKLLHVYRLHHLYQCTDLSDIRSLDMGRRLVMNGEEGSFMMSLFGTTFHDFADFYRSFTHEVDGLL